MLRVGMQLEVKSRGFETELLELFLNIKAKEITFRSTGLSQKGEGQSTKG